MRIALVVLFLTCSPVLAEATLDLIAFGDWGAPWPDVHSNPPTYKRWEYQRRVATALGGWLKDTRLKPEAVVLLGDNFYGPLASTEDPRWKKTFSEMYPRDVFPMPFYFVIGNHDYEDGEHRNWQYEMEYTGDDRWRAPSAQRGATWMRVDLPEGRPLLSLFLLNNVVDGVNRRGRASGYLGFKDELAWLDAEVAKPRRAAWVAAASHYPPFTNGAHHKDDGPKPAKGPWFNDRPSWDVTRGDLLPRLTKGGIDLWLGGHDHNQQRISHPDWPGLDILIAGDGGGTPPYSRHPLAPKEPLLIKAPGWLHLHLTEKSYSGTFYYLEGSALKHHGPFERRK